MKFLFKVLFNCFLSSVSFRGVILDGFLVIGTVFGIRFIINFIFLSGGIFGSFFGKISGKLRITGMFLSSGRGLVFRE